MVRPVGCQIPNERKLDCQQQEGRNFLCRHKAKRNELARNEGKKVITERRSVKRGSGDGNGEVAERPFAHGADIGATTGSAAAISNVEGLCVSLMRGEWNKTWLLSRGENACRSSQGAENARSYPLVRIPLYVGECEVRDGHSQLQRHGWQVCSGA